jgi:glycosyltransferase involved in cell wall biosynthesis
MHVLLIHQAFVSPKEAGGTRHFEFARSMVDRGERFTIVASDLSYLSGRRVTAKKGMVTTEDLDNIQVLRAFTFPSLHRSFLWRTISFVSFMVTSVLAAFRAEGVDVVMGTSPPIFQAASAWFVAVLLRKPFLLEVRDLWPEFAIDMGVLNNPLLIKLARAIEKFLYARAKHIIVNSPAYQDYLIDRGVSRQRITLIPNGVDPTMFDANRDGSAIRQKFSLNDHFVATYAGALGMANDIPTILRAADLLRNNSHIHFLLVGDGKERASLESVATELGLSNVTFTGSIPKSQMADVLAASDVCLATLLNIPMFQTTYPNKVFDYMAASRPTVLGIDGVIRSVVEDAQGGIFVQPGDERALSQAIVALSTNPTMVDEMGKSARLYVEEHFDRTDQARKFAFLLKNLV